MLPVLHLPSRPTVKEESRSQSSAELKLPKSLKLETHVILTFVFQVSISKSKWTIWSIRFIDYTVQIIRYGFQVLVQIFILDMNVNYLTARVQAPSGGTTDAQIIETEDSNYSIRFVPRVSQILPFIDQYLSLLLGNWCPYSYCAV